MRACMPVIVVLVFVVICCGGLAADLVRRDGISRWAYPCIDTLPPHWCDFVIDNYVIED